MDKKAALIILDGVGISQEKRGNALSLAKKPFLEKVFNGFPKALLKASGQEVGLPWGEVGNSEVGHSGIGLGRVILQDLPQIDKAIIDGTLKSKNVIRASCEVLSNIHSNLHIVGLTSDGGIHSHIKHAIALYKIFREKIAPDQIFFHVIADGRDSKEKSVEGYVSMLRKELGNEIRFGSISGRFYAMDRDKNWDRIEKAYHAILGKTPKEISIDESIKNAYARGETDEFITPQSLQGCPEVNLDLDIFIFYNYRADRAVQLTRAFVDQSIPDLKSFGFAKNFITMTTYSEDLHDNVLFTNIELDDPKINPLSNSFSQIISQAKLSQAHIAETEKFAHISYFFSGGVQKTFDLQKNILIESKKLKSYDIFPQMKAKEISSEIVKSSNRGVNFILANYANGDMVGHSGKLDSSIKAIEIIDQNLAKVIPHLLRNDYLIFLTSDHGNCEEMIDLKSSKPNKEHTLNPVPFFLISKNTFKKTINATEFINSEPIGVLADIAPTILDEFEIGKPIEMSGISLKKSLL